MFNGALKLKWLLVVISAGIFSFSLVSVNEAKAVTNLSGRILLQVQDKGQAWYVNPLNARRYYLGRPDDAFGIMRSFGLGVSNYDLNSFFSKVPARLAGRILLKVQDKGQAYYVDPVNLKLYYLGRPLDAFNVMKTRGLGISNRDLATIPIGSTNYPTNEPSTTTSATVANLINDQARSFAFKYQTINYEIIQPLSTTLYNYYKNSPKVYSYTVGNEPDNLREEFYGLFLKVKINDSVLDELIVKLKNLASANNWSENQFIESLLSFIQYIPYDHEKVAAAGLNSNPYFPYETLYLDKGVCSDKTFLAITILRKLGYGAAILDFPERNHTALGIACPKEYSLNGSGYCYGETTNYFPLGIIPQSISDGQAQTADEFTNLFNSSNLGRTEIYQATTGKIYGGMPALRLRIDNLKALKSDLSLREAEINVLAAALAVQEADIDDLKSQLGILYNNGQISEYNRLVSSYNSLVNQYNSDLTVYRQKIAEDNIKISEFNSAIKTFYQQ